MASSFHLTVIGTRFPQLALATLMAKRGRKVLIVDGLDEKDSGDELVNGYMFRNRPAPLFGLDSDGFLRKFLDEIGIGRVLVNQSYPPHDVSYQVVLPRHRINVYPDRDRFLAELAREFPSSLEEMRQLYHDWDEISDSWREGMEDVEELEKKRFYTRYTRGLTHRIKGIWQARKLNDQFKSMDPESPEVAFLALQNHMLGGQPLSSTNVPLSTSLIHSVGKRGTFRESMGTRGITELLLQRFREFGGELLQQEKVTGVDQAGRENLTLLLASGRQINTKTMSTSEGLASGIEGLWRGKIPVLEKSTDPVHPIRFYLGLEEKVIPLGMEDNLLLMREDDGGPLGLKCCFLALSSAGSEMAPKGKRSLTVTSFLSADTLADLTRDQVTEIRDDLLLALESVIPFLGEGLDHFSSDLSDLGPADELRLNRSLGTGITAWIPGIIGRMAVATRYKGRVAIIKPTPNELGIEGEALAALSAAGVLRKAMGTEG
jgi:phytoene dehydrogenase-like protein